MSELEDKIIDLEYYKKKFSSWDVTEQIIDDKKAFYMIKKSDSNYQKVCLYRDEHNIFIYGDYGQFTFNNMTWLGTPHNLEYDNISYQLEKMSVDNRKQLYIFDNDILLDDLKKWFEERIRYDYEDDSKEISKNLFNKLKQDSDYKSIIDIDVETFCENNNCDDLYNIICFIQQCYYYVDKDENEWIHFLKSSNLHEFEDTCESSLWNSGKVIEQCFYLSLYALKICGEKLLQNKTGEENEV